MVGGGVAGVAGCSWGVPVWMTNGMEWVQSGGHLTVQHPKEGCRPFPAASHVIVDGLTSSSSYPAISSCFAAPQMRSRRNFCVDIILVCILLGIVAYIASMVQVGRRFSSDLYD